MTSLFTFEYELSPISQIKRIWRSFENSKFYGVCMISLSVLPPSLAASFENLFKPETFLFGILSALFVKGVSNTKIANFTPLFYFLFHITSPAVVTWFYGNA